MDSNKKFNSVKELHEALALSLYIAGAIFSNYNGLIKNLNLQPMMDRVDLENLATMEDILLFLVEGSESQLSEISLDILDNLLVFCENLDRLKLMIAKEQGELSPESYRKGAEKTIKSHQKFIIRFIESYNSLKLSRDGISIKLDSREN